MRFLETHFYALSPAINEFFLQKMPFNNLMFVQVILDTTNRDPMSVNLCFIRVSLHLVDWLIDLSELRYQALGNGKHEPCLIGQSWGSNSFWMNHFWKSFSILTYIFSPFDVLTNVFCICWNSPYPWHYCVFRTSAWHVQLFFAILELPWHCIFTSSWKTWFVREATTSGLKTTSE